MKKVDIKNKVVARGGGSLQTPSKGAAASVDLSAYLLASVFAEAFEVQQTEDGERYVLAKLPMAVQGGITMFADGGVLDLPTIYDGIPVDGNTIYWEDVALPDGGTTRVLKAKGGSGTGGSVLRWSGFTSGSFDGTDDATIVIPNNTNQLINGAQFVTATALNDYAKEEWVANGFLALGGGTLTGPLTITDNNGVSGGYLYFGDVGYCYLYEESDDFLVIYARAGIDLRTGNNGSVTINGEEIGGGGSLKTLSWTGYSTGSYDGTAAKTIQIPSSTEQLENGAGFITEEALDDYLPLSGGTITGNLRLKGSGSYGNALYFGDGSYCYLKEDTDDHLYVYASKGFDAKVGTSYYFGIEGKGVKVNGGILTYNSSSGYWELQGDLLVNGQITMVS